MSVAGHVTRALTLLTEWCFFMLGYAMQYGAPGFRAYLSGDRDLGLASHMGQASNRKKQRAKQRRDRPHLLEKIREQREVLRLLGDVFDASNPVVGYPLSTTIRVLVHQTTVSHALLEQSGDLSKMPFRDTSLAINPANLLAHGGLVVMQMTMGQGAAWIPRLAVPGPSVPGAESRDVPFGSWWKTDVMKDHDGIVWSRSRMVLSIANKEGGAHIDPTHLRGRRARQHERCNQPQRVGATRRPIPSEGGLGAAAVRQSKMLTSVPSS
jgi:hypothetical protein